MRGERRPRPDVQVAAALARAKVERLPFEEAWPIATDGQVCDSYTSARGGGSPPAAAPEGLDGAPNLRASGGQKRCAGCRFVHGAGNGVARCTLYGLDVYAGILWPHRTHDRHEWRNALLGDLALDEGDEAGQPDLGTMPEWRASYDDEPTRYSVLHEMLAARAREGDLPADPVYGQLVQAGTLAA